MDAPGLGSKNPFAVKEIKMYATSKEQDWASEAAVCARAFLRQGGELEN